MVFIKIIFLIMSSINSVIFGLMYFSAAREEGSSSNLASTMLFITVINMLVTYMIMLFR